MGAMIRNALLLLVAFAAALAIAFVPQHAAAAQAETCTAPAGGPVACRNAVRERTPAGRLIPTWRETAVEDDRRRLRLWREAFVEALEQAHAGGHGAEIEREGALLDPDSAIAGATLPAGEYRCRTLKLGSRGDDGLTYVPYEQFRCRVAPGADGLMHFTKLTGSQRPVGRLFPEHDRRQIFLGTIQLGDERRALGYGRDADRNMAGAVERIGERRWRIVFPYPHYESVLDVIELTYLPSESRRP